VSDTPPPEAAERIKALQREGRDVVPRVTIKTGIVAANGQEEVLTEYLCDWQGCPSVAEHVVGAVLELATAFVFCREHATLLKKRASNSGTD
jgi:hypothetical protein